MIERTAQRKTSEPQYFGLSSVGSPEVTYKHQLTNIPSYANQVKAARPSKPTAKDGGMAASAALITVHPTPRVIFSLPIFFTVWKVYYFHFFFLPLFLHGWRIANKQNEEGYCC